MSSKAVVLQLFVLVNAFAVTALARLTLEGSSVPRQSHRSRNANAVCTQEADLGENLNVLLSL